MFASLFWLSILQGVILVGCFDDLGDLDSGSDLDLDSAGLSPESNASNKTCPLLNITNATPATKERSVGSMMVFTCIHGYKKDGGDDVRECLPNLSWSGKDVVCKLVTCPSAPDMAGAEKYVSKKGTSVLGTNVTYTCMKNYRGSNGNNVRTCQKDGKWSKSNFECSEIVCPKPPRIPHASVNKTRLKVGSIATYACAKHYRPIGTGMTSCLENGTWSELNFTCASGLCRQPPPIDGAVITGSDFSVGQNISYTCKPGTYPRGGKATIRCLPGRKWSKMTGSFKCVEYRKIHAKCRTNKHKIIKPVLRIINKRNNGFGMCFRRCNRITTCRAIFVQKKPNKQVACRLLADECPKNSLASIGHPSRLLFRKKLRINMDPNRPSVCYTLLIGNCAAFDILYLGNVPKEKCLEACSQRPYCKSIQWLRWNPGAIQCWAKTIFCRKKHMGYRGDKRFHQYNKVPCQKNKNYKAIGKGRYNLVEV